jgi:hypothetical protein
MGGSFGPPFLFSGDPTHEDARHSIFFAWTKRGRTAGGSFVLDANRSQGLLPEIIRTNGTDWSIETTSIAWGAGWV